MLGFEKSYNAVFTASILVVLLRLNLSKILPVPRALSADSWNSRQDPAPVSDVLALNSC